MGGALEQELHRRELAVARCVVERHLTTYILFGACKFGPGLEELTARRHAATAFRPWCAARWISTLLLTSGHDLSLALTAALASSTAATVDSPLTVAW